MIDRALARRIRFVGIDVDGVLTDGGIYLGDVNGKRLEMKRFHIQDGLGIRFLRSAGIFVAVITGRVSESVRLRCEELDVDACVQNEQAQKLPGIAQLADKHGFSFEEMAFLGDDFPDLAVLRQVGLPVAVGNAVAEVRAACTVQLERRGGEGAVREFAEELLKARGEWDAICEQYVAERSSMEQVS